jgi:hypothetical protein
MLNILIGDGNATRMIYMVPGNHRGYELVKHESNAVARVRVAPFL